MSNLESHKKLKKVIITKTVIIFYIYVSHYFLFLEKDIVFLESAVHPPDVLFSGHLKKSRDGEGPTRVSLQNFNYKIRYVESEMLTLK